MHGDENSRGGIVGILKEVLFDGYLGRNLLCFL
jgi:hypothetical protein